MALCCVRYRVRVVTFWDNEGNVGYSWVAVKMRKKIYN